MNCHDQSVKTVGGTEASKVTSPKELCPKKMCSRETQQGVRLERRRKSGA